MQHRDACTDANGVLLAFVLARKHDVGKLIMSSSPSTRFDGSDIDGLKEDELAVPKKFLQVMRRPSHYFIFAQAPMRTDVDAFECSFPPLRVDNDPPSLFPCSSFMQRARRWERRPYWKRARTAF